MIKITTLASEPKQKLSIMINNSLLTLTFEYKVNQLGWFFGFEYEGQKYQNIRLTTSYNILRAYRNWLPFGIACQTIDGFEPMDLDDFVTDYASVYLLSKEDVNTVEGKYYVKATQDL